MKPTILIFIDWFLPGYKAGGPIRSVVNLIDHLSDEYSFYVITRDTDYYDNQPYINVNSDAWNEIKPGVQVYYFSKEGLNKKNMLQVIGEVKPNVIYINGIYSWWFSILPLVILRNTSAKIVVAPRGMLSGQAFSSKSLKKKIFLLGAKTKGIYNNITFQSTSSQETEDIGTRINGNAIIKYAPNLPKKAGNNTCRLVYKKKKELRLVNVARISPEKNNGFAVNLLKDTKGMNILLDLYGPIYDKDYYENCLTEVNGLHENIKVNFKGPASPEELEDLLPQYHFLLFPSTGENFGHAIYEALAMGIPVIISDQTPWHNLAASSAGWDLPLNDRDIWINVLKKCYEMDQEEYRSLCIGAQKLATKYVEESDFLNKYKALFG